MTGAPPSPDGDAADDPVARNRAVSPRRTPGRTPAGAEQLRPLFLTAAAAIAVATIVLVAVLAASS